MANYFESGFTMLKELAKDAAEAKALAEKQENKEDKAIQESEEFKRAKEAEAMARRVAAFGDCG